MTLSKDEVEQMREAAKPLMDFLTVHCHPHCKVIVDSDSAEVVESVARAFKTDDKAPS
jgi:hypothetical protein